MHSSYTPTTTKPVTIEAKLDCTLMANRMIFDGSHNSEASYLPKDFKVWLSMDGENWELAAEVESSTMISNNWQVLVEFDKFYTFNYYRFEITASHSRFIALRKIIFQNYFLELTNGKHISPDSKSVKFYGDWKIKSNFSSFGHVYVGAKRSTLEMEFEGSRLMVLSLSDFGKDFKVEIDGNQVSSIAIKKMSSPQVSFISPELKAGKHKVKIWCGGAANIDSFVIW